LEPGAGALPAERLRERVRGAARDPRSGTAGRARGPALRPHRRGRVRLLRAGAVATAQEAAPGRRAAAGQPPDARGPQLISGQEKGNVFTVDERTITQLMLSQLAGGLRGFELGCWNSRSAGGEAGDYALLDRHNKATPRTMRAGLIGQAAREHRDELWAAQ